MDIKWHLPTAPPLRTDKQRRQIISDQQCCYAQSGDIVCIKSIIDRCSNTAVDDKVKHKRLGMFTEVFGHITKMPNEMY